MFKTRLIGAAFAIALLFAMSLIPAANWTNEEARYKSNALIHMVYGVNSDVEKRRYTPKVVIVNYEGKIKKHISTASSPVFALLELGYPISTMKKVISTSPMNTLYNHSYIYVFSYRDTIDEVKLEIPYQRIVKGGTLCERLSQKVLQQEGVLGIMTQKVRRIYERGELVMEEILDKDITREPRAEIYIIKGPDDSPKEVPQIGYSCEYWFAYVDTLSASAEEKRWLKWTMKYESGCNAENNRHPYYKGLFQWDPCLWYQQYPSDSIFDGRAQIKRTLEKLRGGANPARMWPAVYKLYVAKYGELSWL